MAYGLKITNPSGGLVIDSSGFGMNYIGTASYYGTTPYKQVATSLGSDFVFLNSTPININEYRITSTADSLIPFLSIGSYTCALVSVSKINSNTWSILAYTSGSLTVYCFAKTSVTPSGYGMALYDSSGSLSYNFVNAGSPLFFKSFASFPNQNGALSPSTAATVSGSALSSYTTPAAFGWNLGYSLFCGAGTPPHPMDPNTYQRVSMSSVGMYLSSGTLYRTQFLLAPAINFDAGSDLPAYDSEYYFPDTTVAFIEASGLVTA